MINNPQLVQRAPNTLLFAVVFVIVGSFLNLAARQYFSSIPGSHYYQITEPVHAASPVRACESHRLLIERYATGNFTGKSRRSLVYQFTDGTREKFPAGSSDPIIASGASTLTPLYTIPCGMPPGTYTWEVETTFFADGFDRVVIWHSTPFRVTK